MKYYNTDEIREVDAHYNFVIGERSNGKTTAVLRDIVKDWYERGKKGAIVRQMEEDIKGHKGASLFSALNAGGMIPELTDGEYHHVKFYNRAYYMVSLDEDGMEKTNKEPFAHIFAVSQAVHYKSNSYPNVGTIFFDEFMRADQVYLKDEVVQFLNLVSTIVREKDEAKIFLVANTISWNSPYFIKFGLRDVAKMKPGELATFGGGKTGRDMKVAVEYCESTSEYGGKASDIYFQFDDERVAMITDGSFAIPRYPQCPISWKIGDVKCTYWFDTDHGRIRGRLIKVDDQVFVFCEKVDDVTYEAVKDDRRDLFYSAEFRGEWNHHVQPTRRTRDTRTGYLADAIGSSRMFFADNETGEDLMYFVKQMLDRSIVSI